MTPLSYHLSNLLLIALETMRLLVLIINLIALIYYSSNSLEEKKLLKLSLICIITFLSMYLHSFKKAQLNRVGCVVMWVTSVRGLLGSVGAWVAWVKFLRGSTFYVGHNFYVGYVGQIYFCVGPNFFAWVFAWVKIFYVGPKFLRWSTFSY